MAHYHLQVSYRVKSDGPAAERRALTILGRTRDSADVDIVAEGWVNLPAFCLDDPVALFRASDLWERANGRLFLEFVGALPRELDTAAHVLITRRFVAVIGSAPLPVLWTVRAGRPRAPGAVLNPHFRAIACQRVDDGLFRTASEWFHRANGRVPAAGGAPKDRAVHRRSWLSELRRRFADIQNEALAAPGLSVRVDPRSHADRFAAAVAEGDHAEAARLFKSPPQERLGMAAVNIERGRPGRPGQPSARGEQVRARQRRCQASAASADPADLDLVTGAGPDVSDPPRRGAG